MNFRPDFATVLPSKCPTLANVNALVCCGTCASFKEKDDLRTGSCIRTVDLLIVSPHNAGSTFLLRK